MPKMQQSKVYTLQLMRSLMLAGFVSLVPTIDSAQAETLHLTFLHVNDVYEYAPRNGWGGLAELATLIDAERVRNSNTLFTFGGDLLSPSIASNMTKGRHMIEFMNALGADAAVLGNHEFDFGAANLRERIGESKFPWLGANVTYGGTGIPGVLPHIIRDMGGVKVGLFGILTAETSHLAADPRLTLEPEISKSHEMVAKLRHEGADIVVAITHLDLAQDLRLAREVKGVDLILGGHDHDPAGMVENGVLVLRAGSDAHWLAVIDLLVDKTAGEGAVRIRPPEWRFLSTAGIAASPRLAGLVRKHDDAMGGALSQPLGRLTTPIDSRTALVRSEETAIGNLFADALRSRLASDVALINGGGFRANRQYPAGTALTLRDLLAEMPFGNIVVAVEVSGAQILELLEHGLAAIENKAGRFPQISGMTVTYDPKAPPGKRVGTVTIGGRPLDRIANYRLATTDYLARGGDGYSALPRARVLVDAAGGPLLANVVADFITQHHAIAPKVDGRLKPITGADGHRKE
ncbi:MAG: bifunctional metallophosphatase/5'-nucleotidase [Alphaproteobacteria bacterium]